MTQLPSSVLALDIGDKRVGIAVASLAAGLPRPLMTLDREDSNFFQTLQALITSENVSTIVVGYPRNLAGQTTGQTTSSEAFAEELGKHTNLPIHFQDEAVTSKQAEAELEARHKPYKRGDIDALAATYILEDYLSQAPEPENHDIIG